MKMVYAFKLCLSKRLSNHNCRDAMSEGFFPLSHSVLYRNGEQQIGYIVQPENTFSERQCRHVVTHVGLAASQTPHRLGAGSPGSPPRSRVGTRIRQRWSQAPARGESGCSWFRVLRMLKESGSRAQHLLPRAAAGSCVPSPWPPGGAEGDTR